MEKLNPGSDDPESDPDSYASAVSLSGESCTSSMQGPKMDNVQPSTSTMRSSEMDIARPLTSSMKRVKITRRSSSKKQASKMDIAQPSTSKMQTRKLDIAQPSTSKMQVRKSDIAQPSTSKMYAKKFDITQPSTSKMQTKKFDIAKPSTSKMQVRRSDIAQPSTSKMQAKKFDIAQPSTSKMHAKKFDIAQPSTSKMQGRKLDFARPSTSTMHHRIGRDIARPMTSSMQRIEMNVAQPSTSTMEGIAILDPDQFDSKKKSGDEPKVCKFVKSEEVLEQAGSEASSALSLDLGQVKDFPSTSGTRDVAEDLALSKALATAYKGYMQTEKALTAQTTETILKRIAELQQDIELLQAAAFRTLAKKESAVSLITPSKIPVRVGSTYPSPFTSPVKSKAASSPKPEGFTVETKSPTPTKSRASRLPVKVSVSKAGRASPRSASLRRSRSASLDSHLSTLRASKTYGMEAMSPSKIPRLKSGLTYPGSLFCYFTPRKSYREYFEAEAKASSAGKSLELELSAQFSPHSVDSTPKGSDVKQDLFDVKRTAALLKPLASELPELKLEIPSVRCESSDTGTTTEVTPSEVEEEEDFAEEAAALAALVSQLQISSDSSDTTPRGRTPKREDFQQKTGGVLKPLGSKLPRRQRSDSVEITPRGRLPKQDFKEKSVAPVKPLESKAPVRRPSTEVTPPKQEDVKETKTARRSGIPVRKFGLSSSGPSSARPTSRLTPKASVPIFKVGGKTSTPSKLPIKTLDSSRSTPGGIKPAAFKEQAGSIASSPKPSTSKLPIPVLTLFSPHSASACATPRQSLAALSPQLLSPGTLSPETLTIETISPPKAQGSKQQSARSESTSAEYPRLPMPTKVKKSKSTAANVRSRTTKTAAGKSVTKIVQKSDTKMPLSRSIQVTTESKVFPLPLCHKRKSP